MSNSALSSNSLQQIQFFPHAKINLGLFIKGKRPDGYHLLETLLFPIQSLSDELTISASETDGCRLSMEGIEIEGDLNDNLCVKAYRLLEAEVGKLGGVNILLKKGIPAGAGLGGGSSDAAYTLKGLKQLFNLDISIAKLASIGAKLGADVPFFLYEEPMMAKGIGTDLSPFPLDLPYEIRLVTPHIHSSTIAAYKTLDYRECHHTLSLEEVLNMPITSWKKYLVNDLEKPVFGIYPELAKIKQRLYDDGAVYAAMSGSGSCVFGLFAK